MIRCVLFDMDGTLVDSMAGIRASYRFAFDRMGMPFPEDLLVREVIGAPLLSVFRNVCGLREPEARRAAELYRKYYAAHGLHQAHAYPGMRQALLTLKRAGLLLGTATLKKEAFAREILRAQELLGLFDVVCGMDGGDTQSKADLIRRCLSALNVCAEEAVLVGDSPFDAEGAAEAGSAFLPVTYGFGYQEGSPAHRPPPGPFARAPREIPTLLGFA